MELTNQQKNKILFWYSKYCYKHKFPEDIFDINSEIDSNITSDENINIIEDKLKILSENGTLDKENQKIQNSESEKKAHSVFKNLDVKRILKHDFSILLGKSNEGKTMFLVNIIKKYTDNYTGQVFSFGMDDLADKLGIKKFSSLIELENIRNSIVVIDEIGALFDLSNRKLKKQIENVLRLVNHHGNKILASGVSSDFKKFLCSKAKCFIYKSLNFSEMINGSLAKELLLQYQGSGVGFHSFQIDKNKVLIYDGVYYSSELAYLKEFDTKLKNEDLFCSKNVQKK